MTAVIKTEIIRLCSYLCIQPFKISLGYNSSKLMTYSRQTLNTHSWQLYRRKAYTHECNTISHYRTSEDNGFLAASPGQNIYVPPYIRIDNMFGSRL